MKMSSRVQRSWQELVDQCAGLSPGDPRWVPRFREWVRDSPAGVSKKTAEALATARAAAVVLGSEPTTLPVTKTAAEEIWRAVVGDQAVPRDPEKFAAWVNALCWRISVFRRDDDGCAACCSGDLEVLTDGQALFPVCNFCNFVGESFDMAGRRIQDPAGLRPATRPEILARAPALRKYLAW